MSNCSYLRLQIVVFILVSFSFSNVYITQPILPILQNEFAVDMITASFSVSAVFLGITISSLFFGFLIDRISIYPIVILGGVFITISGLFCSVTNNIWVFIAARFLQGVFIPCLTTCPLAYLSKLLSKKRLNIIMGVYVSAIVTGGLCGRLLGGLIYKPPHWRYAFVSASILTISATFISACSLPAIPTVDNNHQDKSVSYIKLIIQWRLLRIYLFATCNFAMFSAVFNYLSYRLTSYPFSLSIQTTALLYLTYIAGIFIGPLAGRIINQFGTGKTLFTGSFVLIVSLVFILLPNIIAVVFGLLIFCVGFFTLHAAAIASVNSNISNSQGRANALYFLFYYIGGWLGITGLGVVYKIFGWDIFICTSVLITGFLICISVVELKNQKLS